MSEKSSEKSLKVSRTSNPNEGKGQAKPMCASVEAQRLLREIAAPFDGRVGLLRIAMFLRGWTHNRIKDVYYGDRRIKVSGDELEQARAARRAKEIWEAESDPVIKELRSQLAELRAQVAELRAGVRS